MLQQNKYSTVPGTWYRKYTKYVKQVPGTGIGIYYRYAEIKNNFDNP